MRGLADQVGSRREFFRAAARYSALGVLTAVGALMAGRSRLGGQKCVNQGICRGCGVFAICGLPQAMSARSVRIGKRKESGE